MLGGAPNAVVGAFSVVDQHTLTPPSLWQRFRHVAGIGKQDFMAYYTGHATGTRIAVGEVLRPDEPMCLHTNEPSALGAPT